MSLFRFACPILIAGVLAATVLAEAAIAASPAPMTEITRLADVPAQIRADLGVDDKDVISDRGGPFNAGCILVEGTPSQRFMLAALGERRAIVAVEYGGFIHGASNRFGLAGDRLWVRETCFAVGHWDTRPKAGKAGCRMVFRRPDAGERPALLLRAR